MSNYSLSVLSGCPYKERGFTVCRSLLLNILNMLPEYIGAWPEIAVFYYWFRCVLSVRPLR